MIFDRLNQLSSSRHKPWLACSSVLLALSVFGERETVAAPSPGALPEGGNITHGRGQMQRGAGRLDVLQQSDRLIAEWNSFNVGSAAHVHFDQPGSAAFALNRVDGRQSVPDHGSALGHGTGRSD